jgi:hypothetical protein
MFHDVEKMFHDVDKIVDYRDKSAFNQMIFAYMLC